MTEVRTSENTFHSFLNFINSILCCLTLIRSHSCLTHAALYAYTAFFFLLVLGILTSISLQDTFASSHTAELLPFYTLTHLSKHSLHGINCFQDVPSLERELLQGRRTLTPVAYLHLLSTESGTN